MKSHLWEPFHFCPLMILQWLIQATASETAEGSHFLKFYLFIYFGLHWVSTAALRLSIVAVSGGCSSLQCLHSRCSGLSCFRAQAPGTQASVAAALRLSICGTDLHSATCGIFPDQGSNPCPLHWQAESHLGKFRVIFKALLGGNRGDYSRIIH